MIIVVVESNNRLLTTSSCCKYSSIKLIIFSCCCRCFYATNLIIKTLVCVIFIGEGVFFLLLTETNNVN